MVPVEVGEEKEGFCARTNCGTVVLSEGVDEDGGVGDLVDGNVLVHLVTLLVVEVLLLLLLLRLSLLLLLLLMLMWRS